MTFREKLADWISGGALSFEREGWRRCRSLRESNIQRECDLRSALAQIARMETERANATVRCMAKVARETLNGESD